MLTRDLAPPLDRPAHLRPLTGLRFIAALHVVVFHLMPRHLVPRPLLPLVETGYVGVSLFFVLSGFILAYTYGRAGPLAGRPRRRFWRARVARIYPVYLLGLLVALPVLVALAGGVIGAADPARAAARFGLTTVATLLLAQAWVMPAVAQWNSPGWTLSCEAFFYAVFPGAAGWLDALTSRRLLAIGGVMAALALLPPLVYLALAPDGLAHVDRSTAGFWLSILKYNPLLRLPEFLLGAALGLCYLRTAPGPGGSWLVALGSAATLAMLLASESIPYVALHNGLLAIPFAAIIYGLARGGGIFGWILGTAWLVLLGEASYALYILHVPVARWALPLGFDGSAAHFAILLMALGAISILVNRYLEDPLRRRLRGDPAADADGVDREPTALGGTAPRA